MRFAFVMMGFAAYGQTKIDVFRQARVSVPDIQRNTSNPAVLDLAQNCSSAAPCLVGFGSRVVSLLQSATVTLGGTATGFSIGYIYVSPSGMLTVGHNAPAGNTVTCSTGCTVMRGVTQFPENVVPLFTWSMTWTGGAGRWDAAGGFDKRALVSTKTLVAGPGVQITDVMGESTIGVNTAVVGMRVAVPATATTQCAPGSWAMDVVNPAHLYICYRNDSWVRIPTFGF